LLAELARMQAPPATQKYPVALEWDQAQLLAFSPKSALIDWCMSRGLGAGSIMVVATDRVTFLFYPPGWKGPAWTPENDVRWRALEMLGAYSERKARLARERLARHRPVRGRRLPRTLIDRAGAMRGAA
jgi:hypothetical protein